MPGNLITLLQYSRPERRCYSRFRIGGLVNMKQKTADSVSAEIVLVVAFAIDANVERMFPLYRSFDILITFFYSRRVDL